MKINLTSLIKSKEKIFVLPFSGTVEIADIIGEVTPCTPAAFDGVIRRAGEGIFLELHITLNYAAFCGRCLEPISGRLELNVNRKVIKATQGVDLYEGDFSENYAAYDDDGAIDLGEIVVDEILLGVPSRHLCREECKGLCPDCGCNLNTKDLPIGECDCARKTVAPMWRTVLEKLSDSERDSD